MERIENAYTHLAKSLADASAEDLLRKNGLINYKEYFIGENADSEKGLLALYEERAEAALDNETLKGNCFSNY